MSLREITPSTADVAPQTQPRVGLTFKEKLGYGLGDTASHFVWDMVGFWLLIFYTDVYKIPAAAAGTIMLIARFWDMGIDPVIGIISDRTQTRWGKFRPYILFGALPYAVLAVLTFTTPDFGVTGKIIYACATYVLLMTAYAAVNLPYSSLAAVMTSDTYERAGVNQYRFICAFVGQLVVTGLALTLAKYFGGGDEAMGYQHTLILFGCLSVVFFFITFMTTKERVQPLKSLEGSIKEDLKNLFKNRPWIILAIVGIVSFVMFAMQNAAIAYYFKYYIGKEKNVQLFNVIGTIALIVALPFSKPLARRFGNKNVFHCQLPDIGRFLYFALPARRKGHYHHLCVEYTCKNGLCSRCSIALDHDRRFRGLFGMEKRAKGHRLVFFSRDICAKGRLGHRRRHRRLAPDGV